jgi:hypothetical protein
MPQSKAFSCLILLHLEAERCKLQLFDFTAPVQSQYKMQIGRAAQEYFCPFANVFIPIPYSF